VPRGLYLLRDCLMDQPEPCQELGGAYWFYQDETLGFRAIFVYWP
jgi:hypothetical protein